MSGSSYIHQSNKTAALQMVMRSGPDKLSPAFPSVPESRRARNNTLTFHVLLHMAHGW